MFENERKTPKSKKIKTRNPGIFYNITHYELLNSKSSVFVQDQGLYSDLHLGSEGQTLFLNLANIICMAEAVTKSLCKPWSCTVKPFLNKKHNFLS